MSLRCKLGIHNFDEWRCKRCHKENPRLTAVKQQGRETDGE